MKKAINLILIFLYPAAASFIFLGSFRSSLQIIGLIENTLFSILFILPAILIENLNFRKGFLCFGFIFNSLIICSETAYFYLYGYNISESTIYILMETHKTEASEFLSMFVDRNIILCIVIFLIPILFCRQLIAKRAHELKSMHLDSLGLKIMVPFAMLIIMATIIFTKLNTQSVPLTTFKSLYSYKQTVNRLDRLIIDRKGGRFSDVRLMDSADKETFVIIIGESSTRSHFGLYGYYRQTTPYLNKISSQLFVYNDVIAPHTTTIQVLAKALTPGNYENPRKITDGTLMQLMNKAGFKTFWISNQKPYGTYESITSKLSRTATERYFLDSSSPKSSMAFDEGLLKPFRNALNDTVSRKFIMVHLLAAHAEYEKRYPSAFAIFKDIPATKYANEEAWQIINEYDNAIAYVDYIVSSIIEEVRIKNSKSFVLYFSDHGEDVFESKNMAFHSETEGTKPMYDVPFIVWLSEDFRRDHTKSLVFDTSRKFMTDDLLYSVSDLSGVSFAEYEPERSVFNKSFKRRKRIIFNANDYDCLFP